MKPKVAVFVPVLLILAIGAAALAVNTRILDTSPQTEIGRANEVLVPGSAEPARATNPATAPAPAAPQTSSVPTAPPTSAPTATTSRGDDTYDDHSDDRGESGRDDDGSHDDSSGRDDHEPDD
ncbi:MAG: hypothetical protein ACXWZL_08410 [Mycobacterium sp.]